MVDYRDEVRLGKAVLARTVEAYRKIRNTFRYLLSNLYDFDPATRRGAGGAAAARSIGSRSRCYARLARERPRARTTHFDFQTIFHAINEFVTVDLSAFYLDVVEGSALHVPRRRARAALGADRAVLIADGLARLLAPILSITADEIWRASAGRARAVGPPGRLPGRHRRVALGRRRSKARWTRLLRRARAGERARSKSRGSRR